MLNTGIFVCALLFVCSSWASVVNSRHERETTCNQNCAPAVGLTERCLNLAAWGRCEFYQCVEDRFPCGEDGFVLKYGKYFCDKVDSLFQNLTPEGQRYMNLTSICLTSGLKRLYQQNSMNCSAIQSAGVRNIIDCQEEEHNDMSFCDFARSNSRVYMQMFDAADASRMIRLDRGLTYKFFVTAVQCAGRTWREAISRIGSDISSQLSDIAEGIRRGIATFFQWWSS